MKIPSPFVALASFLFLLVPVFAAEAGPVPQMITSPLGQKMVLKFHDEFDPVREKDGKPYIDRGKWQTTFWQGSSERTLKGNLEAQYYMDKDYAGRGELKPEERINPFSFEKPGILTISATKVPEAWWHNFWMSDQRCFASGLLISDKAFTFKYGYVEGRFKLPPNRGAWSAFWMLPNDPSQGEGEKAHPWPPEIDIFEYFGAWKTKYDSAVLQRKGEKVGFHFGFNDVKLDISKEFHTWAVEWSEAEIVLFFDGKVFARSNTPDSMKVPMYLLVNLAVGGKWYAEETTNLLKKPVKPWEVDEASMPWKMECDYVRVYQAIGQKN